MNKYLKLALCAYPLIALAEENKENKEANVVIGGNIVASYLYPVTDSFSVGAFAGAGYHATASFVGTVGVAARFGLDLCFVSAVKVMAGVSLFTKSVINAEDKNFNAEEKAALKFYNDNANGYVKGGYGIIAFEVCPYASAGVCVEYMAKSPISSKGYSVGFVVMPTYQVTESIEFSAMLFAGYSFNNEKNKDLDIHAPVASNVVKSLGGGDDNDKNKDKELSDDQKNKLAAFKEMNSAFEKAKRYASTKKAKSTEGSKEAESEGSN